MLEDIKSDVLNLLTNKKHAVLGTISQRIEGYPFCTSVDYILHNKKIIILTSLLAQHTKNFQANSKISLFIGEDLSQTCKRMTITGNIKQVEEETKAIAEEYFKSFPQSLNLLELDFNFYEITLEDIRYIGGPGMARWITPSELFKS